MERSRDKMRLRSAVGLLVSLAMVVGIAATSGTAADASRAAPAQAPNQTPIVFVHGALGSGAQYRSPAMRFTSNGFPADRIRAFDYNFDSTGLNEFIDDVRAEFGVDQVNVAAHSLGTAVMLGYLLNPFNAFKVDKYVALDGVSALCIWGTECTSITAADLGQTHIEASLSPESFARQYEHFMGEAPQTTEITPQPGTVEIAGRALNFQVNTPADGAEGEVWPIDPDTGARTTSGPHTTFSVGSDGNFGPIEVESGQPYEITLTRPTVGTVHYYYQPFIHDTYLLRLQALEEGSGTVENTNVGPDHAAGVVLRYREWWRSHGAENDDLTVSVSSEAGNMEPTNVLQDVDNDVAGIHLHDDEATPGQTTLSPLSYFSSQAFQTGVDVYMPGAATPNGTITFSNDPRGDASQQQVINIPNWASEVDGTRHGFLVEFNDYVQ